MKDYPMGHYIISLIFYVTKMFYYTPCNKVVGGYTGFTMSIRPSVDKSYVVR